MIYIGTQIVTTKWYRKIIKTILSYSVENWVVALHKQQYLLKVEKLQKCMPSC